VVQVDDDLTIWCVVPPTVRVEETVVEVAPVEDAQPELIRKRKEEEEEEE
jgi:hypothetical protein